MQLMSAIEQGFHLPCPNLNHLQGLAFSEGLHGPIQLVELPLDDAFFLALEILACHSLKLPVLQLIAAAETYRPRRE